RDPECPTWRHPLALQSERLVSCRETLLLHKVFVDRDTLISARDGDRLVGSGNAISDECLVVYIRKGGFALTSFGGEWASLDLGLPSMVCLVGGKTEQDALRQQGVISRLVT